MIRLQPLTLLLTFFSFLIVGCDKNDNLPNFSQQIQKQIEVSEIWQNRYEELLESHNQVAAINILLKELGTAKGICDAEFCDDSSSITWKVDGGFRHVFTYDYEYLNSTKATSFKSGSNKILSAPSSNNLPHTLNSLILEPFYHELPRKSNSFLEQALELLTDNGYNVTYKSNNNLGDQDIKIEDFLEWSKYGAILVWTHGNIYNGGVEINTGVKLQNCPPKYKQDLIDGLMYSARVANNPNTYIGVTYKWFEKYYNTPLEETFIYISSCFSQYNSTLQNTLLGNNSVYFGWTSITNQESIHMLGLEFLPLLTNYKMNCEEAYNLIKYSPYFMAPSGSKFGFAGNNNFRLTSESNYKLEIVSGNNQVFGGGGIPYPMVIRILNTETGKYVENGENNFDLILTGNYGIPDGDWCWLCYFPDKGQTDPDPTTAEAFWYVETCNPQPPYNLDLKLKVIDKINNVNIEGSPFIFTHKVQRTDSYCN